MIRYIDRKTNALCEEKVYGEKPLSLLYGDSFLSKIFSLTLLPLLARLPLFSQLYGFFQKSSASRSKIKPFIHIYQIDTSEFATREFRSFNDFFIRKLKTECRPIIPDVNTAAMPADGRYLAYPQFDRFLIKGQEFNLSSFLDDRVYARRFETGSLLIARLCPVDYHRFHFPCDGTPSTPRLINGSLFSVNPIALKKRIAIFWENKRVVTEIDTPYFGAILYVEIGATAVGTIRQTFARGQPIKKGSEKGYFEFGGSCLVLLFEKNRITFDRDLVENTKKGFETLARMGESMGKATK